MFLLLILSNVYIYDWLEIFENFRRCSWISVYFSCHIGAGNNDECSTDSLRTNSTDKNKLNYMTNNYHLLNPTDGNYRNEYL